MRLVLIVLLALGLNGVLAACSDQIDDSDNGGATPSSPSTESTSPSPSLTVEAPTPTAEPKPTPTPDLMAAIRDEVEAPTPTAEPKPTPTPDLMAAIRDEAEAVCPSEYFEPCIDGYVGAAESGLPVALCVSADIENMQTGTWFTKTPPAGAKVGDPCQEEAGHFIVALANMGNAR